MYEILCFLFNKVPKIMHNSGLEINNVDDCFTTKDMKESVERGAWSVGSMLNARRFFQRL
jgi:hypothetical protein